MSRYIDLTGQRFGKLVVKEYAPSDGRKGAFWLCQCDCGNTTVVAGQELRRGGTKSCGWLKGIHPIKDYTGQKIGMLTVLRRADKNIDHRPAWVCQCSCGNIVTLRSGVLKAGQKSCGCMQGARSGTSTEDLFRKSHNNRLYNIWTGMNYRCTNPKFSHWQDYGGKGIRVCDEWKNNFQAFAEWAIAHGYASNLEIDRIDSNGNYCPENCRWIDHKDNSRNRGVKRLNKTGVTGVTWRKARSGDGGSWRAVIVVDGKNISLGTYANFDDAVAARKEAELKYWSKQN